MRICMQFTGAPAPDQIRMSRFLDLEAAAEAIADGESDISGTDDTGDSSESEGGLSEELPLQGRATPKGKSASQSKPRRIIASESDEDDILPLVKKRKLLRKKKASHGGQPSPSSDTDVLKEIRKSNKLLATLVKRVGNNEKRLKAVEEKVTVASSGVDSTPSRRAKSRDVPDEVRRETRRVYALLLEEDSENFHGWTISPG